ncbi:MAG: GNAT family N-acetyltransferase [Deltaproteobacteria bacterium]
MSLIQIIENNIFAIGRYWGSFNSSINGDEGIYSMNTGIDIADLNWVWNEKPLAGKDTKKVNQLKKNYEDLKLPFWWWVYPCGQSKTTKEILQNEGFNYLEAIPCLAVDVDFIPLTLRRSKDIEIAFVNDEAGLKIWEDISFTGFKMPQKARKQYNTFVEEFDLREGSSQKLLLAYFMGQPVATTLLFLQNNTAGIYFVTTLAAYRNKGIALALVLESMRYAKSSGYKYCVLQSSKEGLDVYLRAGFKEYCRVDVYCLPE